MSTSIGGQQYRCPRCSQAGEWTDGTVAALGSERDEYWCQYCGEETPLEDCERVPPYTEQETTK
jgi:hypothetical protein